MLSCLQNGAANVIAVASKQRIGKTELNPLLAFNPEDVRMLSFHERAILLTIGNKLERVEFASHEEVQESVREWLEGSGENNNCA